VGGSEGIWGGGRASVQKKDLPDMIEIAIGAKVLVTQKINTDLDVMNGA